MMLEPYQENYRGFYLLISYVLGLDEFWCRVRSAEGGKHRVDYYSHDSINDNLRYMRQLVDLIVMETGGEPVLTLDIEDFLNT